MNRKIRHPVVLYIDSEHINKARKLAKIYKTTPIMIIYGLLDKQFNIMCPKYGSISRVWKQ